MKINNSLYIRRSRRVCLEASDSLATPTSLAYVATLMRNIEPLGFTLSGELVQFIANKVNKQDFLVFANNLVKNLRKMKKSHVKYEPMYPNFPKQVAETDEAELYLNALFHYLGDVVGLRILPDYKEEERDILFSFKELEAINLGSEEDFRAIFTRITGSKIAISEEDRSDLEWFFQNDADVSSLLPDSIPNKENLTLLINLAEENYPTLVAPIFARLKTATDVLRSAVALSGNEVTSLSKPTRFINFKRATRKAMLSALNSMGNPTEDMLRYKEEWKRLGEKLHPGEFSNRFPKAFEAFNIVRNNLEFEKFITAVEKAISDLDVVAASDLLSKRPGEFARRIDQLLRNATSMDDANTVLSSFEKVADKVSTVVLWQLYGHIAHRSETAPTGVRTFMPKGEIANLVTIPETREPLSLFAVSKVASIVEQALVKQYSTKDNLGKVYVDEKLKQFAIPSSVRNASRALNTLGRGSRISVGTDASTDVLRLFVWWKDGDYRTDLDLSVGLLDEYFNMTNHISYTRLRTNGAIHSGDITSAPNGASEFVDLDVSTLRAKGIRYAVMSVYSFTHQPFFDLPECFAGFMVREKDESNFAQSGGIFDPRTVEQAFDLTSDTQISIPLIFDLERGEAIWADLALRHNLLEARNIESNRGSLQNVVRGIVSVEKPTLYDLFVSHADARGELVSSIDEADTVFDAKGMRPNVGQEEVLSEYL
jgi:hypothetical protein